MPPPQRNAGASAHSSAAGNQIASSNATANTFLGGRQPSWMTPGAPTRTPISRPAVSRPTVVHAVHQQHQQQHQQPQPAVLPSPAPSDEPSPALSNILDSPKTNPAPLTDAHNMGSITPSAPTTLPVTDARFVHVASYTPDAQELPRLQTVGRTFQGESRSPPLAHVSQLPSGGAQGASVSYGGSLSPTVPHEAPPPPKRRRTNNPPSDTIPYPQMLPVLEQYFHASGGDAALEATVEKPRVMLLRDACRNNDGFFVLLHQLFSIWSLNRQEAYQCMPLNPSTVDQAFAILETVLKKNQLLSPAHQHWFSRFPAPAGQLTQWNNSIAVIKQIAFFLDALVDEYGKLAMASMQRRYPFLVDELLSCLGCYSPVLQFILFTACRRRLGVLDDQFGSSMEQAFREDQHRHCDASGRQTAVPLTHAGEIEQRNSNLIEFYKLTVQAAAFRASGQPNYMSPPLPSTPSLQPAGPTSHTPSTRSPQQRQAHAAYSAPGSFRPIYPSTTLPSPSGAPMATASSYAASQQTSRPGPTQSTSPSANAQPSHHQVQITPNSAPHYSAAGSLEAQQPQASPQYSLQAALQEQQLRSQQLNQQLNKQLNQHQYQRNLQITTPVPTQGPVQSQTHSPTGTALHYLRSQLTQSPQLQQMYYNPWTQQAQPVVPPAIPTGNGVRPGSARATQSPTLQLQRDAPQRQRSIKAKDPLFPPKGSMIARTEWPHEPADRKSILMSLHQAHARSPKRIIKDGETERLYQAVKSLPVPPTAVAPKKTMYEFRFQVTEEQFVRAATRSKKPGDIVPVVEHFNGALRWRVRSCMVRGSLGPLSEEQWVTLDTSWPSFIHMTLNHKVLDIRRQSHNGKDLPTEITDFVVYGTNVLMIAVHNSHGEKARNCHLAIEMLETLSHSSVMDHVWSQGATPEEQTLDTIKRRLTSSFDDEVSFEAPDLSIDLADPFSAKIFKVPARGVDCTHMECFDLENWLNTRPAAKPTIKCAHKQVACDCRNPPEPSNPDKWRCPICNKDARPCSLRVDEFLLKVRVQLEAEGKLHTKRLLVKVDGSWSVVLEEADDDDESDGEGRQRPAAAAAAAGPPVAAKGKAVQAPPPVRREVEVIEID